jgi:hypothetical protein
MKLFCYHQTVHLSMRVCMSYTKKYNYETTNRRRMTYYGMIPPNPALFSVINGTQAYIYIYIYIYIYTYIYTYISYMEHLMEKNLKLNMPLWFTYVPLGQSLALYKVQIRFRPFSFHKKITQYFIVSNLRNEVIYDQRIFGGNDRTQIEVYRNM